MFSETYFGERHVPKNTRRSYPTSKSRIWEKNEEKKLVLSSTPPNKNRLWSSSKNWWCWETRSRLWEQIQIKFSEAYLDAAAAERFSLSRRPAARSLRAFMWTLRGFCRRRKPIFHRFLSQNEGNQRDRLYHYTKEAIIVARALVTRYPPSLYE